MSIRIKYPKTYHLPWSKSVARDDKVIDNLDLLTEDIVITEKMDGENTTVYNNAIHARSIDSSRHESRSFVKALASRFQYMIPNNWRICGENLFAKHSIWYDNLPSYFLGFAVFDDHNMCLSWKDTVTFLNALGVKTVPVIYEGPPLSAKEIYEITKPITENPELHEGYVIRVSRAFHFDDFKYNIAKYVRKGHVNTDAHWQYKEVVKNKTQE